MSDLYVLRGDGRHVGPMTKDAIAKAMVEGSIPRDVYVAPPGAAGWLHASQMPELLEAITNAMKSVPPQPPTAPARSITPAVAYAPPSSSHVPIAAPIYAETRPAMDVKIPPRAAPEPSEAEAKGPEADDAIEAPSTAWISWAVLAGFAIATGIEIAFAVFVR